MLKNCYGLEIATRSNRNAASSFEKYITESSQLKSNSGLSEKDLDNLSVLNEKSPYWKSSAGEITEIELIAPEPGTGDLNSQFKKLQFPTHAFTLASNFLVLFNVPDASLQSILDNGEIKFNFNKLAANRTQLAERAGLLQFNVVLSALYALLLRSNPKTTAEYTKLAKEWVKIANPVHTLTGNSFEPTIEAAKHLFTLDYQAPIDFLIVSLRDALVTIYEARIKGEVNLDQILEQVYNVEFQLTHVQTLNHIRSAGAQNGSQGEAGGLFPMDERMLFALHSHPDYIATFKHANYDPKNRINDEEKGQRAEKLKGPIKQLNTLITNFRAYDEKAKKMSSQTSDHSQIPRKMHPPTGRLLT